MLGTLAIPGVSQVIIAATTFVTTAVTTAGAVYIVNTTGPLGALAKAIDDLAQAAIPICCILAGKRLDISAFNLLGVSYASQAATTWALAYSKKACSVSSFCYFPGLSYMINCVPGASCTVAVFTHNCTLILTTATFAAFVGRVAGVW